MVISAFFPAKSAEDKEESIPNMFTQKCLKKKNADSDVVISAFFMPAASNTSSVAESHDSSKKRALELFIEGRKKPRTSQEQPGIAGRKQKGDDNEEVKKSAHSVKSMAGTTATNHRPPDDNKTNPKIDAEEDTILEDMISFKFGQEVTVNKIIFEDSDEEFSKHEENILPPSDEQPSIKNIIILGTKKANVENSTLNNKKDDSTMKNAMKEKVAEIRIAEDRAVDIINTMNDDDERKGAKRGSNQNVEEKLGPDEIVHIPMDKSEELRNISVQRENICRDPLFIPTPSEDSQTCEQKKSKKKYPRTKVTAKRVVKKFPGKMDAMKKRSEDLNQSQLVKSTVPLVTSAASTSMPHNNVSMNNNGTSTSFNEPYILPMLTTVVENLLVIFPSLYSYITARKTFCKTEDRYKAIKAEFEKLKLHCFSLSYTTSLYIIVPNKANAKFIKDFCDLAEKIAKERGTLQFSLSNFEILCKEMIEFTENTQKKMSVLHTNPKETKRNPESPLQMKKSNPELCNILQSSPKPVVQFATVAQNVDSTSKEVGSFNNGSPSVIKFKTGPPGSEIEISYNKNLIPQDPTQITKNHRYKTNSSTTLNVFPESNTTNQLRSVANKNTEHETNRTPMVATSNFDSNRKLSHQQPNVIPSIDMPVIATSNALRTNNFSNEVPNSNAAVAAFHNTWKPNIPVNTMSPQLNYMDTYSTYVHARVREGNMTSSCSISKPANNDNSAKRGRQNQAGPLPLSLTNHSNIPNTTNLPSNPYLRSPYHRQPPPPYQSHQNQQNFNYNNYQMSQTNYPVYQNGSQVQQHSSCQNMPQVHQLGSVMNTAAPIQERSSISRDSGLMSPLDETLLNMLEPLENMNSELEAQQRNFAPVITCVTSLDPSAPFVESGYCSVCNTRTNLKCLGCNRLYYCGYDCQKYDWVRHGQHCSTSN